MREYVTEAIVLEREPMGELDLRITFFTRDFGKIVSKAKSARKVSSKLSPHLEPANFVKLRLIEKGGFQVADALRFGRLPPRDLPVLSLLCAFPTDAPDLTLFTLLARGEASPRRVLAILGFNPSGAVCSSCGAGELHSFSLLDFNYLCSRCAQGATSRDRLFVL